MSLKETVLNQCERAKEAALKIAVTNSDVKNIVLDELADDLKKNSKEILAANKKDLQANKKLPSAMLKRLVIDDRKIQEMCDMVRSVAKQEDPTGKMISEMELDDDLTLEKITVPIGVIGCIFESRPEVVVQIAALAIKSGNAVLLKGGKEALHSNLALTQIIRTSIEDNQCMPADTVQLLETREEVKQVLKMDDFIDLLIPRGSNGMVKFIQDNTKIPVLGHAEGICNVYVDKHADLNKAMKIAMDSKTQYAAVCNAMENLVVHKDVAQEFVPRITEAFLKMGVEVRADSKSFNIIKKNKKIPLRNVQKATEKDWKTEYNEEIISIKVVDTINEAVDFINTYGSGHTDAIITEDKLEAQLFINFVDSSSVVHNASTRFADGFRYGLGAEVGISTNKVHARGPVGLEGLVITKFILRGIDHIVDDYAKGKKTFTHKKK
ncbi:MAG: glutamate-5-semialdehyde dehydrogenase [Nanoarchaeota archaeon]|nr:glutamate-5-semialdehyde dehydrogenase [Nanoarchaeota archaeon]